MAETRMFTTTVGGFAYQAAPRSTVVGCVEPGCGEPVVALTPLGGKEPLRELCVAHLVEIVNARAEHRAATADGRDEIDLLVGHIHGTYHALAGVMGSIEELAKRFPECADMPDPAAT